MIQGASELVDEPASGPVVASTQRVRLSDTTADGEVRLDALARYAQDVGNDDARAAMPGQHLGWVVRRTLIQVTCPARSEEQCAVTTWCSGWGSHWAERRVALAGEQGGRCDLAVLWVAIDPATGRAVRLPDGFHVAYGETAGARRVHSRLSHGPVPADAPRSPWRFRQTDVDILGHVNNTALWAVAEEHLAGAERPSRLRAELEYRRPVDVTEQLWVVSERDADASLLWLVDDTDAAVASYVLRG